MPLVGARRVRVGVLLLATTWGAAAAVSVAAPASQPASRPGEPAVATADGVVDVAPFATADATKLLAELASADWRVRRDAQDQLARGGAEAKPFIARLIQKATTAEARKNAEAALAQIDEDRLIGPSYVTLHVRGAPASRVVAELARQCFAPLPTEPADLLQDGSLPKLTLDVDREPFWKVMPEVCQKLAADFRLSGGKIVLTRNVGGPARPDGVSVVAGPFLVVATGINYTRSKSFAGHGEQSRFGMNISVLPEPKLNVLRAAGTVEVEQATDDRGNSLLPKAESSPRFWGGLGGGGGYGGWTLYLPLQYPRNIGTRIAKLKGSTRFIVQLESEKLEIADVASLKPTTRLVHHVRATFQEMKQVGEAWQLRVHVDRPPFGDPDWQQFIEGAQTRMKVLDADGNALDRRGTTTSINNATFDMTLDYARNNRPDGRLVGPPTRIEWDVPTKTREVTVPIEFHDLPLFDEK